MFKLSFVKHKKRSQLNENIPILRKIESDFSNYFDTHLSKEQAERLLEEYEKTLRDSFEKMDTDTINDKINTTLDLVQNCLKEEDVEVYKSTVFR